MERTKHYSLGDRVILNGHYDGDYMRFDEGGYRVGRISEVVAPGRLYSIALDGYHNRFVDFAVSEFQLLDVASVIVDGAVIKESTDVETATKLARQYYFGCAIIQHDRRIDASTLVRA